MIKTGAQNEPAVASQPSASTSMSCLLGGLIGVAASGQSYSQCCLDSGSRLKRFARPTPLARPTLLTFRCRKIFAYHTRREGVASTHHRSTFCFPQRTLRRANPPSLRAGKAGAEKQSRKIPGSLDPGCPNGNGNGTEHFVLKPPVPVYAFGLAMNSTFVTPHSASIYHRTAPAPPTLSKSFYH